MKIKYPYSKPEILKIDIEEVTKVLRKGYLTQGSKIKEFEIEISRLFGSKYASVCNSGTAALHMIYKAIGLNEKNGLMTTPITFLATANAARMCNAPVEFTDVDSETGLMTPELLEVALKNSKYKIKAVTIVHLGGRLCELEAISDVCKKYKCILIEDACHAPGAKYISKNKKFYNTGSCRYSDASSFSFHAIKHITMGEGGCITTNNEKIFNYANQMRNHFMIRENTNNKKLALPWYYKMEKIGWNYRADEISCALGLSQLKRLKSNLKKRRSIAEYYLNNINVNSYIKLPNKTESLLSNAWHLFPLSIDFVKLGKNRATVIKELSKFGIGTQVHYIPLFMQPYYKKIFKRKLKNALTYYKKTLSIPIYVQLKKPDLDYIINALNKVLS
tara:strand:+ start:340 stop:1509 length:1170 start_codon:yes stop_codon:yes gene_type:complete